MGKRRADADTRRFLDEFPRIRVSRFRAEGTIDPAKREALIPFPNGKTKLIGTAHTKLKWGGGWSYFRCPKCGRRSVNLYLIEDAPRCTKCCAALNVHCRAAYGFGRDERRRHQDKCLDDIIAMLETNEPIRLKTPASWAGKAKVVYNSRKLAQTMRRKMVTLRLNQLASQQAGEGVMGYTPLAATKQLIQVKPIWRAQTSETLQKALDKAQAIIIAALNSNQPQIRINAAKLMLRTKQARERGL